MQKRQQHFFSRTHLSFATFNWTALTYRCFQLLCRRIDAYVPVVVLAHHARFNYIKIDGVVKFVRSAPAYGDGVLRVTRQVNHIRWTRAGDIGALYNLIGGVALVFHGERLDNDTVIGEWLCNETMRKGRELC